MTKRTEKILVCCGTGCIANGALDVAAAIEAEVAARNLDVEVSVDVVRTGCSGECEQGPVVRLMPRDTMYYRVKESDASAIIDSLEGDPVEKLLLKKGGVQVEHMDENPFYALQHKVVLKDVGIIDPLSLDDYIAHGGYEGLKRALEITPEQIIDEVDKSGLRGKGGAGFPTGRKWRTAAGYDVFPKYIVCNGDEGDPGAFMDGSTMEGSPHAVIEGMIIGALAIGAEEGILYIRDEYALARDHIQKAIDSAYEAGILGDSILGTSHKLHLSIVRGGGAFVCGESTALMASIEGRVGEPRAKYIRSVQRGLFDHPTVLNNVETLASIPTILRDGGEEYAKLGTENSKGTKVFAMVGKVKHTGLVEVPMGTTLRTLIYDIGGGIIDDRHFKASQTGGPSGGRIPESLLDLPVDFDTLTEHGAMMGSGGMIVMDDRSCMVEVARYYVDFLCEESCGKCTPCREGLRQMRAILTDICEGRGQEGDIELLERICHTMEDASLCALGRTAANPVLTTIKFFRDEYEAHIKEHRCPAGVCAELTQFVIDAAACTGCGMCMKACPADAISGEKKTPHSIDQAKCIACGSCREACHFSAVLTEGRSA
ncbi:MAG: 4Fe-4S binding protein [Eggerthellaceae bacterium]|nr:4Fe-4S binding protein [Eggerthellaceae bacterium]